MPRKPNIENLLKRSARVRALAWCTERVNKTWGTQGDAPLFTEEEQETLWASFSTERECKILEKTRYQEGQLRHFFPLLAHRMTLAVESTHAFDLIRSRYLESIVHEKILSDILKITKKNKQVYEDTIDYLVHFQPVVLTISKPSTILETPTIALNSYLGKSFTVLLQDAAREVTERVQLAKSYIAVAQEYINRTRCHIKFYDKIITRDVGQLKHYLDVVNDTPTRLENFRKRDLIASDSEILKKDWLPAHYDDLTIEKSLHDAGCFQHAESPL